MADLLTGLDSQVWISNAAVADTVDTSAEFAALTWVALGSLETVSEYGDASSDVTGNVINEGRTRHAKGVRDAGVVTFTCFVNATDAGQVAFQAAEKTSNRYGIKISPRDRPEPTGTDSITYFRGLVQSFRKGALAADDLQRVTIAVGIDSALVEVAAAEAP